jgi:fimbrial chaperone protein
MSKKSLLYERIPGSGNVVERMIEEAEERLMVTVVYEMQRELMEIKKRTFSVRHISICLFLALFFMPALCLAGAIKVVPTKLYLSAGKKTEVLKVKNEGDNKVTIQVEAVNWSQGEGGKDSYEPTEDIVFFPKIFTVEKGKELLLRVGAKDLRATAKEAAYRVFLQEIPVSKPGQSQLTLALRLSIPVFIKPAKEVKEWAIEKVEFSDNMLLIKIKNNGNSHISVGKMKAKGINASNQEVYQKEEAGWYVLPGVVRTFGMKIPEKECLNSAVIKITAEVGDANKEAKLDVDKALCPKEPVEAAGKKKESRP